MSGLYSCHSHLVPLQLGSWLTQEVGIARSQRRRWPRTLVQPQLWCRKRCNTSIPCREIACVTSSGVEVVHARAKRQMRANKGVAYARIGNPTPAPTNRSAAALLLLHERREVCVNCVLLASVEVVQRVQAYKMTIALLFVNLSNPWSLGLLVSERGNTNNYGRCLSKHFFSLPLPSQKSMNRYDSRDYYSNVDCMPSQCVERISCSHCTKEMPHNGNRPTSEIMLPAFVRRCLRAGRSY